jgi:hypothetical protein
MQPAGRLMGLVDRARADRRSPVVDELDQMSFPT